MRKLWLVFMTVLVVCTVSPGSGKVSNMYLEEAVRKSDLIIIGQTVRIVETEVESGDFYKPKGTATVRVEKIIKGTAGSSAVDIVYQPCVQAGSATYSLCERSVLFLSKAERSPLSRLLFENSEGKYFNTGGYLGKISIGSFDNMVTVLFKGKEFEQVLDKFLQRLEQLIKGNNGQGEKEHSPE